MEPQRFTHENEVLAMAPLSSEDEKLFLTQSVYLVAGGEIQWDFVLNDGKDHHFRQQLIHLLNDAQLSSFKRYMRNVLLSLQQETMTVVIDQKEVSVPFHYEIETGGRRVKVPDLEGEFLDATCIGDTVPTFISARR